MASFKTPARTAKEQFDRQADHYNALWNAWSEESLAWLRDHADAKPEEVVLDVATGTGFTALAFAPRVRSVVGLDVSPGMLAKARQQAQEAGIRNVTFQEGSAERLSFPDAAFDIVTCRIAAHHFLSVPQFLREAARVLKPGGRFLLADTTVPDDDPEADAWQNDVEARRDPSHVRCYTPREWRRFVEAAGFVLERMDSAGGIPIVMSRWLINAGCTPEQSADVGRAFAEAPAAAVRAFRIERLPDGDVRFVWQRAVLKAVRLSPAISPAE
jgi:ubiquinone/menaquinone biosynthesis C-methylase UbiE